MTDTDFLQLHLHQTDHAKQLDIGYDAYDLQKLQILLEYHVINQRCFLNQIAQLLKIGNYAQLNEKNKTTDRCMARIHNGNQCSRRCKTGGHGFCGSHLQSLLYGRIDENPLDLNKLVEKKTRGRKSKNKTNIELDRIDLNNYIKTRTAIIDGIEYLIDDNDVLFENDSANTVVGCKISENKYQWF